MEQFRPMRRIRQQLPVEEAVRILQSATAGVLAVSGDNGYPYAVPVSYAYADGKIYFHSALRGHKIDAIHRNPKVSFCVIDKDEVKPQQFTTYFRSVIAFGTARIVEDEAEKMGALRLLAARYSDDNIASGMPDKVIGLPLSEPAEKEIAQGFNRLLMVEITIEHLTAKEAIELVRQKT